MTDTLRLSATGYTTWLRCPAQARARLDGHYPGDTLAQFKGLLAHRIFARHLSRGHIAPSGFRNICKEEIGSSNLNWKVRDLALKPSEVNQIIDETADLYRRFTMIRPAGTPEVHVEHPLTENVTLIGTIDCVQGTQNLPRLVDWKTGEVGEAADQLRFYATVWTLSGQPMPVSVTAISVLTGEKHEEWINPQVLNQTLFQIVEAAADLTSEGAAVETPGPWCRWCPLLETCQPGQQTVQLVG